MSLLDWREEPIAKKHDRSSFDCGEPALNEFLRRHARQSHDKGAAKTFLAISQSDGKTILGFYSHPFEHATVNSIVIGPGQLWIMDRNFCVRTFLFRIRRTEAFFLVRRHAMDLPYKERTPLAAEARCATGMVFEPAIAVEDTEFPGAVHRLRRIVLRLDQPTREGTSGWKA